MIHVILIFLIGNIFIFSVELCGPERFRLQHLIECDRKYALQTVEMKMNPIPVELQHSQITYDSLVSSQFQYMKSHLGTNYWTECVTLFKV